MILEASKLRKACQRADLSIKFLELLDKKETKWSDLTPVIQDMTDLEIEIPTNVSTRILGFKVTSIFAGVTETLSSASARELCSHMLPFPPALPNEAPDPGDEKSWETQIAQRCKDMPFCPLMPKLMYLNDTLTNKLDVFLVVLISDVIKELFANGEAGTATLKCICGELLPFLQDELEHVMDGPVQL